MATIPNLLFSWQAIEASPEILRFQRLLEGIDDRELIETLEDERKGKRNDYPIRAVWNSILAGIIFQHAEISSLRRELARNAELRQACGFDPILRERAVPSKDAYSRFFGKLARHADLVEALFHRLVERMKELLPDFGRSLAADGKAIPAWRKTDTDADIGRKQTGEPDAQADNAPNETKTVKWFGYKLHMICDATHELPVAFRVTRASEHESPHLMEMVAELDEKHEALLERTEELSADRGYDDGADKAALWDDYQVAPLIPPRDLKEGRMEPLDPLRSDTIYVSPTGEVACRVRPFDPEPARAFAAMQFQGFEKDRSTLKFRCPAAAYGLTCENQESCRSVRKDQGFGRVVRVSLDRDRRLFLPIYRHSWRFHDLYKKRTSVERLFSRFDHQYNFERHTIRGLKRMRVRVALSLTAMLATAVGWIEAGRREKMRSLSPAA